MLEANRVCVTDLAVDRKSYHEPKLRFDMIIGSRVITSGVFYGSLHLFIYSCCSP